MSGVVAGSLSPVANRPAGDWPRSRVTGMSAAPAATGRKVRTIPGRPAKSTDRRDQVSPSPSSSRLLIDFIPAAYAKRAESCCVVSAELKCPSKTGQDGSIG
jgi:hypothetical protein